MPTATSKPPRRSCGRRAWPRRPPEPIATTPRASSPWPRRPGGCPRQLKSETDFSAKSDDFAGAGPGAGRAGPGQGRGRRLREGRRNRGPQGHPQGEHRVRHGHPLRGGRRRIIDAYLHGGGRGARVLIEGTGIDAETLHEIALHVAFAKPTFLSRDEVPADEVDKARPPLLEITKRRGQARSGVAEDRRGPAQRLVRRAGAARAGRLRREETEDPDEFSATARSPGSSWPRSAAERERSPHAATTTIPLGALAAARRSLKLSGEAFAGEAASASTAHRAASWRGHRRACATTSVSRWRSSSAAATSGGA